MSIRVNGIMCVSDVGEDMTFNLDAGSSAKVMTKTSFTFDVKTRSGLEVLKDGEVFMIFINGGEVEISGKVQSIDLIEGVLRIKPDSEINVIHQYVGKNKHNEIVLFFFSIFARIHIIDIWPKKQENQLILN